MGAIRGRGGRFKSYPNEYYWVPAQGVSGNCPSSWGRPKKTRFVLVLVKFRMGSVGSVVTVLKKKVKIFAQKKTEGIRGRGLTLDIEV